MATLPTDKASRGNGKKLPQFEVNLIDRPGWDENRLTELGQHIKARLDTALNDRSTRNDRIRQWNVQYDAIYQPKDIPWRGSSALNIPTTRSIVDTIHAHILRACLGVNPLFRVEPINQEDTEDAEALEKLIQFQMVNQVHFRARLDEIMRYALKQGNSVAYIPWTRTIRRMRDVEPMLVHRSTGVPTTDAVNGVPGKDDMGNPQYSLVERERIDKDQPDIHVINMLDWVMYPATARSIDTSIGCGFRYWATPNDLRKGVMNKQYQPKLAKNLLDNVRPQGVKQSDGTGGDPVVDDIVGIEETVPLSASEEQYELFHLIWEYDYNDSGIDSDIEIEIDRGSGMIVSAKVYPYWHGLRNFINYCPYPRDRSFNGYSLCEILEHIHAERNAIRNQRVDVGTLLLSPMLAITRGVRFDANRPFWRPGGTLVMDDVSQVKPISLGSVTQSAFAEEAAAKEMAEDVSGASSYAQGQSPSRSRTVGEISTVTANGNLKFEVIVGRINESNNELIAQVVENDYQFLDEQTEFAITGENNDRIFTKINRDQIRKQYRITATGNTVNSNKELMIQVAETLYQIAQTNPLISSDLTRIWAVSNFYLHQGGIQDPTPYIGTQEQAKAMQDAKSQAPAEPPMSPVTISGRLDEVASLALLLQTHPDLQQTLPLAYQVYQLTASTMPGQAPQGGSGTGGQQGPNQPVNGAPGAIPTDPGQPRVFPDQVQNNAALAHVAMALMGAAGQSGASGGQQ